MYLNFSLIGQNSKKYPLNRTNKIAFSQYWISPLLTILNVLDHKLLGLITCLWAVLVVEL